MHASLTSADLQELELFLPTANPWCGQGFMPKSRLWGQIKERTYHLAWTLPSVSKQVSFGMKFSTTASVSRCLPAYLKLVPKPYVAVWILFPNHMWLWHCSLCQGRTVTLQSLSRTNERSAALMQHKSYKWKQAELPLYWYLSSMPLSVGLAHLVHTHVWVVDWSPTAGQVPKNR